MEVRNSHTAKKFSALWRSAHNELIQNIKKKPFVSQYECSVHTNLNGKTVYLPAYVPYIGPSYFEYRPRILCYAINQNLSRHTRWTKEWVSRWANDFDCAQDRLNNAAHEGVPIPIRPYVEGFIPLTALISISHWIKRNGGTLPQMIDDVISVTNFVKFSTAQDASSSSIPNIWWKECGSAYVRHEIQVLQPDIILCFGQRTIKEISHVLNIGSLSKSEPKVLSCRFPARIPSIKGRPLTNPETKIWNEKIKPLIRRRQKPKENYYHQCKIQKYPGYFIDVINSWDYAF